MDKGYWDGMPKVWKQDRDDIKVRVNMQSPNPTFFVKVRHLMRVSSKFKTPQGRDDQ